MKTVKEKQIAVVGVSNREHKFGFMIFRDLIESGFDVKGLNPTNGEVLGRKIYRNLRELETAPDMVITVVPPAITEKIVEDCKEIGIREIWMQPGSESRAAIEKAETYGMAVTYNACFMVQNKIW